ncbi:hypothetical protein [Compostibacter hankyongensis]|uniref:Alpha-galactosidase n=1 Tax=Compostibacter hankyongensis TaxID=1007089 RepID=A0ABP8FLD5_9BACT
MITIKAGSLTRTIHIDSAGFRTTDIHIGRENLLNRAAKEMSLHFYHASPNREPEGMEDHGENGIRQEATAANQTDALNVSGKDTFRQDTKWTDSTALSAAGFGAVFGYTRYTVSFPAPGTTRLTIRSRGIRGSFRNVVVDVVYEIYQGYPAIRKWVTVTNNSAQWIKIDDLVMDDLELKPSFCHTTDFTPSERGAVSSIRGFSNEPATAGIIAVSEVPSALRSVESTGAMGYISSYFEWVLGPVESFTSEPVWMYAFNGERQTTLSGVSTPMDRTIEGDFQTFLYEKIGIKRDDEGISPIWCSWSNFGALINDTLIRKMADIASAIGIRTILLDAGWSKGNTPSSGAPFSTAPDRDKFPDFAGTCRYITEKGLRLGLWLTCFRHPAYARDLKVLPHAYSLPRIERDGGLAMSFASRWRYYYANDLVDLHDRYGATYFKQDLTNIKFGDIAKGHDSRTRKESVLRGLRGLLESQDRAAASAPDIHLELTHEIYWGTPGTPCDVAALKHVPSFHVPPNDYSGAGKTKQPVNDSWPYAPDSLRQQLLAGCWHVRSKLYAYRGLPLNAIEYYGAATVNYKGSLTAQVQRRQLCSWLMGAPNVFAGDLSSLTAENIRVYHDGFALLKKLNDRYGIYRHFQYSGVPAPTDKDWHWWGKLNEKGYGAVVVMRGSGGAARRQINIPWVQADRKYKVRLCFRDQSKGVYSGKELAQGKLTLSLDTYDQEIIALTPVSQP